MEDEAGQAAGEKPQVPGKELMRKHQTLFKKGGSIAQLKFGILNLGAKAGCTEGREIGVIDRRY